MMKLKCICILLLLSFVANAQEYLFYGKATDNEVRLFWLASPWPQEIEGFNIKRRSQGESWQLLNNDPIVPSTAQDKNLDNLGLAQGEIRRLTQKRDTLLEVGRLNSLASNVMIQALGDENNIKGLSLILSTDFDISMIGGFGYIDGDMPKGNQYEYGLFSVINSKESIAPVASFYWDYGTDTKINLPMDASFKSNKKGTSIQLKWEFDTEAYKAFEILNGFNIYRKEAGQDFIKLNALPIIVSMIEEKSTLIYKDEGTEPDKEYEYAVAPSTIFNTDGEPQLLKVTLKSMPDVLSQPTLNTINKEQNGVLINWGFEPINEQYIKGFYIQQKADDTNRFVNVSNLLSPDVRDHSLNLTMLDNGYYHFKVIAIKLDDTEIWSNRKIFFNKKNDKPSAPSRLSGEVINEGGEIKVRLTWQKPENNSESVTEYILYTSSANEERLVKEGSIDIDQLTYGYAIYRNNSAKYRFAVSATNAKYEESAQSEVLEIIVPSQSLPFINIWPIEKNENRVVLNWKYPDDIADLAGFRVFQNGEQIASESDVQENLRQWSTGDLQSGVHSFEILAISQTGIESKRSKPRKIEIN